MGSGDVTGERGRAAASGGALRILHVEDSDDDTQLILRSLRRSHPAIEVLRVDTPDAMRAALASRAWDVVLSDWTMPLFSGLDALAVLRASAVDLPFLLVSGSVGEEAAVEAMRAGANDYVLKDRLSRLGSAIDRALAEAVARRAREQAEERLARVESQLAQAQRLEAMGRMAGGIAHDFNNILAVVLSLSQLVEADAALPPHLREDLAEIRMASERASELTKQLFAFSRQQTIAPSLLDLGALVLGLDRMLRCIIGSGVALTIRAAPDLPVVRADKSQLEQIIVNLVVNARDAMPTGGRLTVELEPVMLDAAFASQHLDIAPGPHVKLTVRDTGAGIAPDTLPRIFEPFFTTKDLGKGTGLGLATVFQIVRSSHGAITVESALGQGTTFAIYLPRATPLPVTQRAA